jgi:UPF0042 nucleotide-binding protein
MALVEITSFGYLHSEPPDAHLTIDLRHHFRDPHVSPELRYMTANDEPVRTAVMNTLGITDLIKAVSAAVDAFGKGPNPGVITVASGCAGGRHRAPTFARALGDRLTSAGHSVTVNHRDLEKEVVHRK